MENILFLFFVDVSAIIFIICTSAIIIPNIFRSIFVNKDDVAAIADDNYVILFSFAVIADVVDIFFVVIVVAAARINAAAKPALLGNLTVRREIIECWLPASYATSLP